MDGYSDFIRARLAELLQSGDLIDTYAIATELSSSFPDLTRDELAEKIFR